MNTFDYFAYGSNMFTARLKARCDSTEVQGLAYVDGFRLSFSKRSADGSGKATLIKSTDPKARVWGVLFRIEMAQLGTLDRFEGVGSGYDRHMDFHVAAEHPIREVKAYTYLAPEAWRRDTLKPYDWYQALVLAGAAEHRLPASYVGTIRKFDSIPDRVSNRDQRQAALALLKGTVFWHMIKAA